MCPSPDAMIEDLIELMIYLLSALVEDLERFWGGFIAGAVLAVVIYWLMPATTLRVFAAGAAVILGGVLGAIWQTTHK
jgi:hypothetical protein